MDLETLKQILEAGSELVWQFQGENYSLMKERDGRYSLTHQGKLKRYASLGEIAEEGIDVMAMVKDNRTLFVY